MTSVTNASAESFWAAARVLRICLQEGPQKSFHNQTNLSLATSLAGISITSLACPFTVFLNTLMLIAFHKEKSLLRTNKSNIMLWALALNDLVRSTLGGPLFLSHEISYQYSLGPNCYVLSTLVLIIANVISELLVTALNFERFLCLKCPIWHHNNVQKYHFKIVIVFSFVFGFAAALVRNVQVQARFLFFIFYFICLFATLIFSVLIWWEIAKRRKRILEMNDQGSSDQEQVGQQQEQQQQLHQQQQQKQLQEQQQQNQPQEQQKQRQPQQQQQQLGPQHHQQQFEPDETPQKQQKEQQKLRQNLKLKQQPRQEGQSQHLQVQQSIENSAQENQHQEQQPNNTQNKEESGTTNSHWNRFEKKAAQMATYLGLAFIFTRFLPLIVFGSSFFEREHLYAVQPLAQTSLLLNSLVNPVIYGAMNRDIKKKCLQLLKCN